MSGKKSVKKSRDFVPEPSGPGHHQRGAVEVVGGSEGAAFFRPHVRPRAWNRLGDEERFLVSGLQKLAAQRQQMDDHIAEHVEELRELGVSWDVIAWSVGMTGEGARRRYGTEP